MENDHLNASDKDTMASRYYNNTYKALYEMMNTNRKVAVNFMWKGEVYTPKITFTKEEKRQEELKKHRIIISLMKDHVLSLINNLDDRQDPRRHECHCKPYNSSKEEYDAEYCNVCCEYREPDSPFCFACDGPEYRSSSNEIIIRLLHQYDREDQK